MWLQRRILLFAALLPMAVGAALLARHWVFNPYGAQPLVATRWYAVETAGETASIDLSLEQGERYLLVISSLGAPTERHQVRLTSEPVAHRQFLPVRKLKPLSASQQSQHSSDLSERRHRPESSADVGRPVRATRDFFLHVADGGLEDPDSYVRVSCRLVGEGDHVRVYLDSEVTRSELAPGLVDEVIHVMDRSTIPATSQRLGRYYDVDGDGKFTIVLSPWLNRLQGGRTSLGGFVRSSDFRKDLAPPFSNRCDVMYLNSWLTPGMHLKTLLAHEFTHAVCCSERLARRGPSERLCEEEDWLNEAIAHLSENLFAEGWSNLDHRVNDFLNDPGDYPLIVSDYYRAGLWRNHGCRGATYLFLRWCVDQFGEECLLRLINAPATGARNVELATGLAFEELFRRWSIALAQTGDVDVPDAYRSLDLCGELGEWSLAGPKVDSWDAAGSTQFDLAGTSCRFVELCGDGTGGCRRIRVSAEYGTHLQISLQKRSPRQGGLDVKARWLTTGESSVTDGKHREVQPVAIELAMSPWDDFEVECVTFEARGPQPQKQFRFREPALQSAAHQLTGAGARQFVLPLPGQTNLQKGCIIKVVVRDSQGRRTTARRNLGAADRWLSQFAFVEVDATL